MIEKDPLTVDVPREFHRRMAAIIDAVQTGIGEAGVHDLLGYATDYAFSQQRGLRTLVLKTQFRSAYVRLHWDTVMGDTDVDREFVDLNAVTVCYWPQTRPNGRRSEIKLGRQLKKKLGIAKSDACTRLRIRGVATQS